MNILITGVHGFVGSNLVKALAPYHTIFGIDIVFPPKEGVAKTFSWEDLYSDNVPETDVIIHLAGKAHDTKNKAAKEVYFKVNTGLTEKIFDYFLRSKSKKFIFFSTAKAAADKVEDILTENVEPAPVGPYGESKIAAEQYILKHSENLANEKSYYILRPCMIHGPGNKGNLNLLYQVVSKGVPWPLGAFENRRTFTSIGNLCVVIEGLLTKTVTSGIYHMADDEALSTNELIEIICAALEKKSHIWFIPKGLMNGIAQIGGWLHLPLNPLRMQKLTENYVVSNVKIKRALGLQNFPISAKEGLTYTIKSFKSHQ